MSNKKETKENLFGIQVGSAKEPITLDVKFVSPPLTKKEFPPLFDDDDADVEKKIRKLYRRIHRASVMLNCKQVAQAKDLRPKEKVNLIQYLIQRSRRITGHQVEEMMERLAAEDEAVMAEVVQHLRDALVDEGYAYTDTVEDTISDLSEFAIGQ